MFALSDEKDNIDLDETPSKTTTAAGVVVLWQPFVARRLAFSNGIIQ